MSKYKNKITTTKSDVEFLPTVRLFEEKGSYVEGTLLSRRDTKADDEGKTKKVYKLALIDTNAPIRKRQGDDYVDVEVSEGSEVELFGTVMINSALETIEDGTDVKITFVGKQKNKSSKGSTNVVEVEY